MPDQVELKTRVSVDGTEQLERMVSAVDAGRASVAKTAPVLTEYEKHLKELAEQHEKTSETIKHFGESIRQHIETPIGNVGLSLGKLAEKFGVVGVAVASTVATLVAMGTAVFESAEKLGALGTQINNIAIRTGLSTQEVGQFGFAAKAAGSDISSFEAAMKMLSRGLAENSDEGKKARGQLQAWGIEARDVNNLAKPMSEIFLEISDHMAQLTGTADRNTAALNLFGRAGLDLVPTLLHLRENLDLAKAAGVETFSPEQVERMEEYHKKVLLIKDAFEKVWHAIARASVETAAFVLQQNLISAKPKDLVGAAQFHASAADAAQMDTARQQVFAAPGAYGSPITGRMFGAPLAGDPKLNPFLGAEGSNPFSPEYQRQHDLAADKALKPFRLAGKAGLESDLKQAQSNEAEAANKLDAARGGSISDSLGNTRTANAQDRQELTANMAKASAATLKAQGALDAFANAISAAAMAAKEFQQAHLAELTPLGKIQAERGIKLQTPGLNDLGRTEINAAQNLRLDQAMYGPEGLITKNNKAMGLVATKTIEDFHNYVAGENKDLTKGREDFIKDERDQQGIDKITHGIQSEQTSRSIRGAGRRAQQQFGGPGQEGEAANAAAQTRIALAQQLYDETVKTATRELEGDENKKQRLTAYAEAAKDYSKEYYDAQQEREDKLWELKKQRQEQFASTFAEGALALQHGPASFKSFITGQAEGLESTVLKNAGSMLYKKAGGEDGFRLPESVVGTATSPTKIGELLKGSFLGPKQDSPQIVSTDANTVATLANTAALTAMGQGFGMPMPISGVGGAGAGGAVSGSFASSIPSILGGSGFTGGSTGEAGASEYEAGGGTSNMLSRLSKLTGGMVKGASGVVSGQAIKTLFNSDGKATGAEQAGAGIALAGAAYAGVTTAIKDFGKGGARGITAGIGDIAGTAAAFDPEPISHAVLAGVALAAKVVSSLFGDPKADRQASIQHELTNNAFFDLGLLRRQGQLRGRAPEQSHFLLWILGRRFLRLQLPRRSAGRLGGRDLAQHV